MLRHCPQHARLALLVTAAQRTRELKYVHLMTLWDTFIVLTQVSCHTFREQSFFFSLF